MEILYEDDVLIIVNKPAGVLSQPGKSMDGSVSTQVRTMRPDATGPLLVHRLDMDTSGLLMLAKNATAHRKMQQQFERRIVSKRYIAVVEGILNGSGGSIDLPLRLDPDNRPVQVVCPDSGKPSRTLWRKQYESETRTRVFFTPITGRTHQLRVHAAHRQGLGAAIVGDRLYGKPEDRMLLHAHSLSFVHPQSGLAQTVESPVPF